MNTTKVNVEMVYTDKTAYAIAAEVNSKMHRAQIEFYKIWNARKRSFTQDEAERLLIVEAQLMSILDTLKR